MSLYPELPMIFPDADLLDFQDMDGLIRSVEWCVLTRAGDPVAYGNTVSTTPRVFESIYK